MQDCSKVGISEFYFILFIFLGGGEHAPFWQSAGNHIHCMHAQSVEWE